MIFCFRAILVNSINLAMPKIANMGSEKRNVHAHFNVHFTLECTRTIPSTQCVQFLLVSHIGIDQYRRIYMFPH